MCLVVNTINSNFRPRGRQPSSPKKRRHKDLGLDRGKGRREKVVRREQGLDGAAAGAPALAPTPPTAATTPAMSAATSTAALAEMREKNIMGFQNFRAWSATHFEFCAQCGLRANAPGSDQSEFLTCDRDNCPCTFCTNCAGVKEVPETAWLCSWCTSPPTGPVPPQHQPSSIAEGFEYVRRTVKWTLSHPLAWFFKQELKHPLSAPERAMFDECASLKKDLDAIQVRLRASAVTAKSGASEYSTTPPEVSSDVLHCLANFQTTQTPNTPLWRLAKLLQEHFRKRVQPFCEVDLQTSQTVSPKDWKKGTEVVVIGRSAAKYNNLVGIIYRILSTLFV